MNKRFFPQTRVALDLRKTRKLVNANAFGARWVGLSKKLSREFFLRKILLADPLPSGGINQRFLSYFQNKKYPKDVSHNFVTP